MESTVWSEVDRYIEERLGTSDDVLTAARAASREAGLPEIEVSSSQGKFLHLLARAIAARRILEVGTLGGYSTIWLARALPPGGSLLTLELNLHHAAVARQNLARAGLSNAVEVRAGPALTNLRMLETNRGDPFDLAFVDADKPSTWEYFDMAVALVRPGGVIVVDNVVRKGAVAHGRSEDADVLGMRRFFDRLHGDPRVSATALQTVGTKGHDGFVLAVVAGNSLPPSPRGAPER